MNKTPRLLLAQRQPEYLQLPVIARQQAQQLKGQAKEQAGKVLDKTRELVDKASEKVKEW